MVTPITCPTLTHPPSPLNVVTTTSTTLNHLPLLNSPPQPPPTLLMSLLRNSSTASSQERNHFPTTQTSERFIWITSESGGRYRKKRLCTCTGERYPQRRAIDDLFGITEKGSIIRFCEECLDVILPIPTCLVQKVKRRIQEREQHYQPY